MPSGTVKWFNEEKGYGFIKSDDGGPDVFVHITAVRDSGLPGLIEGQEVNYELSETRPGKTSAIQIEITGDAPPRPERRGPPRGDRGGERGGGFARDRGDRGGFDRDRGDRGERGGYDRDRGDRGDRGGFDRGERRGPPRRG